METLLGNYISYGVTEFIHLVLFPINGGKTFSSECVNGCEFVIDVHSKLGNHEKKAWQEYCDLQ